MPSTSLGGAGRFQEAIVQTCGKRIEPNAAYVRGNVDALNRPSIAIVGTRRPTLYGTQMAERLGREIAARGVTVASGMARGIDAVAHQGATAVNGRAIGVLGTE